MKAGKQSQNLDILSNTEIMGRTCLRKRACMVTLPIMPLFLQDTVFPTGFCETVVGGPRSLGLLPPKFFLYILKLNSSTVMAKNIDTLGKYDQRRL